MAKKAAKKQEDIHELKPGHRLGSAKRCQDPECMGKPKKLVKAQTFEGDICEKCYCVYSYLPEQEKENQQKLEIKAEKTEKKTLKTDEAELEKLIKEADKKEKKKVKPLTGEQGSLF